MSRAGSKVSPIYLLCIEKNRKLPLDCIRTELRSFSFSSVIKFFTNCLVESFLYSAPSVSAAHYVYSINFTEKWRFKICLLQYIVKNSILLNFQRNKPATISNTFSGAILQSKNVCCLGWPPDGKRISFEVLILLWYILCDKEPFYLTGDKSARWALIEPLISKALEKNKACNQRGRTLQAIY